MRAVSLYRLKLNLLVARREQSINQASRIFDLVA